MTDKLLGSIEAGGTKFVLAVADFDFQIVDSLTISTRDPETTMKEVVAFFQKHPTVSIGIGSFGPIDVDRDSESFGKILNTPKVNWRGFHLIHSLKEAFDIPIFLTTDVNSSAYGEYISRNKDGVESLVYFTIGTGVGGGIVQNGEILGKRNHPEMGHMLAIKHPEDDFAGSCTSHGDRCIEGLASGYAIEQRTGIRGEELDKDHKVFEWISFYIAQLIYNTVISFVPDKIVLGGSVIHSLNLELIKDFIHQMNANYLDISHLDQMIDRPIVANNGSATIGNFALAKKVYFENIDE